MKNNKFVIIAALIILIAAATLAFVFVPKSYDKAETISDNYDTVSLIEENEDVTETLNSSSTLVSSEISERNDSSARASDTVSSEKNNSSSSKKSSAVTSSGKTDSNTSSADSKTSSKPVTSQVSSRNTSTSSASTTTTNTTAGSNSGTSSQPQEDAQYYEPEPSVIPEVISEEQFDENGNLIIDTDTLDGKKAIAFTFDDGPSIYTPELLDGLRDRGAHATFFMVGSRVELYPELLPIMVEDGHQIGNHTYNHIRMTAYGESSWRNEIAITDDAIFNACGQYATAFRPPYGSYTQYQASTVDKTFTMWSVDTLDWKTRNKYSVKNEILSHACDGSIVLLHDLYKTSVDAVLEAMDELKQEGYIFVTVDELLTRYGYPISNTAHFSQYPVDSTVYIDTNESDDDTDSEVITDTETEYETDIDTDTSYEETETDIDTSSDFSDNTDTEISTDIDE